MRGVLGYAGVAHSPSAVGSVSRPSMLFGMTSLVIEEGMPDKPLVSLRDRCDSWVDADLIQFHLGTLLGFFAPGTEIASVKHVFWSDNPLGEALHAMVLHLVQLGVLDTDDGEHYLQYRWRSDAPGKPVAGVGADFAGRKLYVDFNNVSSAGALMLDCAGSTASIAALDPPLVEGETVLLSDGEVRAVGRVVRHSSDAWDVEPGWRILPSEPAE